MKGVKISAKSLNFIVLDPADLLEKKVKFETEADITNEKLMEMLQFFTNYQLHAAIAIL